MNSVGLEACEICLMIYGGSSLFNPGGGPLSDTYRKLFFENVSELFGLRYNSILSRSAVTSLGCQSKPNLEEMIDM